MLISTYFVVFIFKFTSHSMSHEFNTWRDEIKACNNRCNALTSYKTVSIVLPSETAACVWVSEWERERERERSKQFIRKAFGPEWVLLKKTKWSPTTLACSTPTLLSAWENPATYDSYILSVLLGTRHCVHVQPPFFSLLILVHSSGMRLSHFLPSVSLALPPVGWANTVLQLTQSTTVWAWLNTVVIL